MQLWLRPLRRRQQRSRRASLLGSAPAAAAPGSGTRCGGSRCPRRLRGGLRQASRAARTATAAAGAEGPVRPAGAGGGTAAESGTAAPAGGAAEVDTLAPAGAGTAAAAAAAVAGAAAAVSVSRSGGAAATGAAGSGAARAPRCGAWAGATRAARGEAGTGLLCLQPTRWQHSRPKECCSCGPPRQALCSRDLVPTDLPCHRRAAAVAAPPPADAPLALASIVESMAAEAASLQRQLGRLTVSDERTADSTAAPAASGGSTGEWAWLGTVVRLQSGRSTSGS